jgi:pimeloyl-ACP methyl ester carboxylesterase
MNRLARRFAVAASASLATAALVLSGIAPASAQAAGPAASAPQSTVQLDAATPGTLQECASLIGFAYPNAVITGASTVAAGVLSNAGQPIGEHCRVTGKMNERVSAVDGRTYTIGFEMRLPTAWSGRYLYQANGGIDGSIATAIGATRGGESGLQLGMAVISSDAGHNGGQNPVFGLDPQARLDYGYQAVGTLTPMAKSLVTAAYGRGPDRSYITGGSNGGRHTMVASTRYADQYDGFLAVAPGFNLPKAAVAQIWGAQQWSTLATTADLASAFTPEERQVVANAILARCDGLDGLDDGMIYSSAKCQNVFSIQGHVPTCASERDGTCLTHDQKKVIASVFEGAETSDATPIYASFPFDAGLVQRGWADWKFNAPLNRDAGAVGYIFNTPPPAPALSAEALRSFALDLDIDAAAEAIWTTSGIYTESAMSFMTPPNPANLDTVKDRGGKMIVIHGASDGVFSPDDTAAWYEDVDDRYRGSADGFVRYYEIPGMGHVAGGPATDQHQALSALIAWVEQGTSPELIASVNPANTEIPADWSPTRTRPLCAYPAIAQYTAGDPEAASSFLCEDGPRRGDSYDAATPRNG